MGNCEFGDGPDFIALEVHYHHECKREYLSKSWNRKKEIAKRNSFNIESKAKSVAVDKIIRYISTSIIAGNKPEFLSTVLERYKQVYLAQEGASKDVMSYPAQSFTKKVRTFFHEQQLNVQVNATKKTVAWKVEPRPFEHATELAKASTQSDFLSIWQCENKLRKNILYLEQKSLEKPLPEENIIEDEVKIVFESLKEFYKILHTGKANEQCSARKTHMIKGSSVDAIFACFGGKLIPEKHLSLGLTVKSLTGSKTMVSLLNCFGHCASDELIRRTDLGLEERNTFKTLVRSHIIIKSNLSPGFAWDDFDINIETPSGANTIHHTYGICYQNTLPQEQTQTFEKATTTIEDASILNNGKRKICRIKKTHPAEDLECLEPYWKKPRLI